MALSITWLGHATFLLQSPGGKKVLFDPWVTGNPTSPASVRLSKALKTRGWTFVGPTTMYALMQAMGMVNDHLDGCVCRPKIEELRRQFKRP